MTVPSPSQLVLITGSTGHVGSATLFHLLRAGYTVRAAVRSESKIPIILARPRIQALNLPAGRLSFVVVPDITAPDAYDAACLGATHVIHVASPLVTGDTVASARQHDSYFIRPAVRGTLGMLEAASRSGTVRRVVITSSIVSLVPVAEMEGTVPYPSSAPPVRPDDRVAHPEPPYKSEFAAYAASKVAALAHAEAWLDRERPAFDVVHLHPSFVLGHNDAATNTAQAMRGTNAVVLALLLGKRFGPYAGATVHVDDVAAAHVASLSPVRVPGNQSYILSNPAGARWNDSKEIAARAFPNCRLFASGKGNVDSVPLPIDASLTEQTFGLRFRSFEDQVIDTVGQFLDLRMQQKAGSGGVTASKAGETTSSKGGIRVTETLLQVRANA